MIDESVLERLLQDEADTYVPPADGPANIELLAAEAPAHKRHRAVWLAATAAATVLGLVLVRPMVEGPSDEALRPSTNPRTVAAAVAAVLGLVLVRPMVEGPSDEALRPSSAEPRSTVVHTNAKSGKDEAGDLANEQTSGSGGGALPTPPLGLAPGTVSRPSGGTGTGSAPAPADAANVIRTGEVTVEVDKARVATALRDATRIASRLGGYVSESQGETASEKPSGFVTIRVPVKAFDQAVEEAGKLGELRRSTSRGQDVSDQVTDVAARLRSLRNTRGQLQTLMSRANTVGEVLSVQDKLNDVQTQIEQLQGKQASLADKTTYGTVKVEVVTKGTEAPEPEPEKTGFAKAWDDAVGAFVSGFEGLVRASGGFAFVLIVGGVLFLVARRIYRSWIRSVV